jgi:hypothetical protein
MKKCIGSGLWTIFLLLVLVGCGPSPDEINTTSTKVAADIFGTQTALVPTTTMPFTPGPTGTSTPTPLPSATALPSNTPSPTHDPSVLFFDDFSDPSSGWNEYTDTDGKIEYAQGKYLFTIRSTDTYYWATPYRNYSNVVIDVDAKKVGGPENNEFGVICRLKDEKNFYLFSISSDGYYGFFKMIDGEWVQEDKTEWQFNDKVILSGFRVNHFKVTCNADSLMLEVNGSTLIDIHDTDLITGDVGLYAGAYLSQDVVIQFDNFKVTKP